MVDRLCALMMLTIGAKKPARGGLDLVLRRIRKLVAYFRGWELRRDGWGIPCGVEH
jgi:hypothetical protein